MNNVILYYTEFKDDAGHMHYAIHRYHRDTMVVDMMKDFKDSTLHYLCCNSDTYINGPAPRYVCKEIGGAILVMDMVNNTIISKMFDSTLAAQFCKQMNDDDKSLDDLSDDPWI